MRVFFTADAHFNHSRIIQYTSRPFKSTDQMNDTIIKRWNNKVRPEDLVYHVGDFSFKGMPTSQHWESMLNGSIVHIAGNHDRNNGTKTCINSAEMEFGHKLIFVRHRPPASMDEVPDWADMMLCGHVHALWQYEFLKGYDNFPIINVGVDVWDFTPVSIDSILKLYDSLVKIGSKHL